MEDLFGASQPAAGGGLLGLRPNLRRVEDCSVPRSRRRVEDCSVPRSRRWVEGCSVHPNPRRVEGCSVRPNPRRAEGCSVHRAVAAGASEGRVRHSRPIFYGGRSSAPRSRTSGGPRTTRGGRRPFGASSAPSTGGGLFGASSAPSTGGGLFGGQPGNALALAQPQASFLSTTNGQPVRHYTQWGELTPQSQQQLKQLEAMIIAAREDSKLLDGVERLAEYQPPKKGSSAVGNKKGEVA